MKIAFIVTVFPALTETFILNQIIGLLHSGHDVHVYTHLVNKESGIHPGFQNNGLMDRVHSLAYPLNKSFRTLKAAGLFFSDFHKDSGKILNSLNPFHHGFAAFSLKRFYYLLPFLNTTYDIIHCHMGMNGPIGVMLQEMGVEGRIVTTFYGTDMSALPKIEKWRIAYEKLFRKGDLFLVEGGHMRDELIKIGCPAHKAKVQHIMVDHQAVDFQPRKSTLPNGKFTMLHCGRFVEKKGLVYGLKALKTLLPKYPNLELRVIGDGELYEEIEQYVKTHDLAKHVVLLGYQPHSNFVEECHRADILLQPSVTAADGDSEGGAPTVLLEAQASGLPIVATHHADIPEVVKDGESGLLSKERDVNDLAEKIECLITDHEFRLTIGHKGREHVTNNYSITSELPKLESLYRQIL
jgi:colanic acid/amylovoran/stewartan biosynthesis glycosyltransferase WcaL/AmsK/CpsK